MILVLLLYLLFASTFTLGKAALCYISPILFIGIRMVAAGILLLGFQYFFRRHQWRFSYYDIGSFFNITLFLIFISFISEFWALQYVTAAKACLLYNMSPFITALLAYFVLQEWLTVRQWLGLLVGLLGFLPILLSHERCEMANGYLGFLSLPEIALLVAVAASCYGWIIMKHLVVRRNYSPIMVNGISMLAGGGMCLATSLFIEQSPRITVTAAIGTFSPLVSTMLIIAGYTAALILIANVICFNLYGVLLRRYSPTFIAFAGFTTPIFAAFFDLFWFGERVSSAFYLTLVIVFVGLWIFYLDELESTKK
jgi:drug/metabolite transporter (DMT)-like permease